MTKDKDGKSNGTNREWLERYIKANPGYTAAVVKRVMDGPPCPLPMVDVWRWYVELANMRVWSDGAPQAIKATEIAAWSELTGSRPSPHEVRLILDLDVRFRNITAENTAEIPNLPEADAAMLAYVSAAKTDASWSA